MSPTKVVWDGAALASWGAFRAIHNRLMDRDLSELEAGQLLRTYERWVRLFAPAHADDLIADFRRRTEARTVTP